VEKAVKTKEEYDRDLELGENRTKGWWYCTRDLWIVVGIWVVIFAVAWGIFG
jgi:hypothetical protein